MIRFFYVLKGIYNLVLSYNIIGIKSEHIMIDIFFFILSIYYKINKAVHTYYNVVVFTEMASNVPYLVLLKKQPDRNSPGFLLNKKKKRVIEEAYLRYHISAIHIM